jgi:hypothetical protein
VFAHMPVDEVKTINAHPVKEFFISIITRDVRVIETIPEFVDNSIDGALRHDGDFEDFEVEISINEEQVEIIDDCGGIEEDLAANYAFRFGRPTDMDDGFESLIGKFGVGMKRSLFKLGKEFLIESKTEDSHFVVHIDVDEWLGKEEEDDWNFQMEIIEEDDERAQLEETGTRILIQNLLEEASHKFSQDLFITRLQYELGSRNRQYVEQGFTITVNHDPVDIFTVDILRSDELKPAYKKYEFEQSEPPVQVEIIAGLGDRSPKEAGWYVYCNGRLVLEANLGETTGWGVGEIPQYHNDFARFRGLVNFKSDDPGVLPWSTTKTDVNPDSPVYRNARNEMQHLMRPILDKLNEISREISERDESTIEQRVEDASPVSADDFEFQEDQIFSGPEKEEDPGPEMTHITYQRPFQEVEDVKELLGLSTNKAAGEETFDYFYNYEIED